MTEKSPSYEVDETPPWEDSPGRALVLGEMGLTGDTNEVMMVSCKVQEFAVIAKVQPAQYEQAQGQISLVPKDLWLHVPISNPGQKVSNTGNVEILGHVIRYIARELDAAVFDTASRRLDLRTQIADAKAEKKGGVKIGQSAQAKREVL